MTCTYFVQKCGVQSLGGNSPDGGGGRLWWRAGAWLAPYDQGCASVCLNWSFERIT